MDTNKRIIRYTIISIVFSLVVGTLLHFTFEFFNNNSIVGAFSAVNESVWEHLKLVFFPMLITTIVGYFYLNKTAPNYLCSKTVGIIIALLFVTVFFYTYTGIIGKNYAFIDIGSFVIAILLGEYITYKRTLKQNKCNKIIASIILLVLLIAFVLFTYFTPNINYFKDSVSNTYGMPNR